MSFSSLSFLFFFLPVTVGLYFLIPDRHWRNALLTAASLFFYSWGETEYFFVVIILSFLVWVLGLIIDRRPEKGKGAAALGTVLCLLPLLYFKYSSRLPEELLPARLAADSLPLGISFYTFLLIAYLVDVSRGTVRAQKSPLLFLLYVSFFPRLISGPIIRYDDVSAQLAERTVTSEMFSGGFARFSVGLAKKVLLANNVAVIADGIYSAPSSAGTAALWLAAFCYTLQIYFDFSGYSDMAIGLSRMFGFSCPENFNYPYACTSVTDFWRRWHISLSSWFRDYVYIPLGGNRRGPARQLFNLFAVWFLTGMWHGASANFIIWGLYYWLLLLAEKFIMRRALDRIPLLLRRLLCLILVTLGWVIFRFTDFGALRSVLHGLFSFAPGDWLSLYALDTSVTSKLLFLIPAVFFAFPHEKLRRMLSGEAAPALRCAVICVLLGFSAVYIISSSYNPFVYFKF